MSFDRPLDRIARVARAPKCGFPLHSLAHLAAELATRSHLDAELATRSHLDAELARPLATPATTQAATPSTEPPTEPPATPLSTPPTPPLSPPTVRLQLHVGELASGDVREARLLEAAVALALADSTTPPPAQMQPIDDTAPSSLPQPTVTAPSSLPPAPAPPPPPAPSAPRLACSVHVHGADEQIHDERSSHCIAASLRSRGSGCLEELLRQAASEWTLA
jgi:hypothetical protein